MGILETTIEYIRQGGWVMLPLGLCSLAMWALIVERIFVFGTLAHRDIGIVETISALHGNTSLTGAGLRARLLRTFLARRVGDPDLDREILQECALLLRPRVGRSLALIGILASVAPLLGLLGTVSGMIATFDVISLFGTGNARALSSGISVALVTTQSGLLVAIPGLLLSAALERRAAKLELRLDETTAVLLRQIRTPQSLGEVS